MINAPRRGTGTTTTSALSDVRDTERIQVSGEFARRMLRNNDTVTLAGFDFKMLAPRVGLRAEIETDSRFASIHRIRQQLADEVGNMGYQELSDLYDGVAGLAEIIDQELGLRIGEIESGVSSDGPG